ncbi:hypothetical protein CR51_01705 [Caballeronia megalochromosomata]|nr:hypothetical protein CR51_01705 [Caballeronia megalochromosomata]
MEARDQFPTSASELRSTDAELEHLRKMIAIAVRHRETFFPLNYWRARVTAILATSHLLPAQLRIASALLDQIETNAAPLYNAMTFGPDSV